MIDFIKTNKKNILINLIFIVLIVFAVFDSFHYTAISFIENSFNFSLSSIGIVAVIKIIAGALPLSDGIVDILDKIFNFLLYANILIGIQYVLLLINKIIVIKLLIILLFFIRFIYIFKSFATKLLIILLFFNPGLSVYVNLIDFISIQSNMSIDKSFSDKIENVKTMLGINTITESKLDANKLDDSSNSVSKTIDAISMFAESIANTTKGAINAITNPIDTFNKVLDITKEKMLKNIQAVADSLNIILNMTIKFMLNSFFLFCFMPFIYFYCLFRIVRNI